MPVRAVVFFVLAAITTVIGIRNVLIASGANSASYNAGYVVGSFLLPLIFLIAGLASVKKSSDG